MFPSTLSFRLVVVTLAFFGLVGCPAKDAGSGSGGSNGSGGAKGSGGITGSGGLNGSGGSGGLTGTGGSGGSNGSGGINGGGGASGTGGGNGGATGSGGAIGPCTAAGIIVCDTFDTTTAGGPASSAKWEPPMSMLISMTMSMDPTPPVVDTARFHSAPNSVRVQGTSVGRGSFLVPVSGLPTANNKVFVRAWVNFQKATSAVTGHNAFIVGAASRDNSGTEMRLGISTPPGFSAPMVDLNLQAPTDGGGEVTRFSNGYTTGADPLNQAGLSLDADHWYCVEAMFDGGNNEFRVWVDSLENTALHVTDFKARPTDPPRTTWAPSYKFVKIGAQNYSGDIGQIWYDDVAIGTQMIGCN